MKRFARKAILSVAAVGAILSLGLATTTVVHAVATSVESDRISPYGSPVTVDGKRMNVVVAGEGPDIVLLPGFGTASPALDFAPLVEELAADHRVTVIEPFGYGLSDGTAAERTTANIVTEIHDAVAALGLERYTLMGHSIAGIDGIDYANRYPDEVTAFVGIDSSVPGQPGMDAEFPTGLLAAAKNLGLLRLVAAVSGDDYGSSSYSEHDREQLTILSNRNSLSPTYLDEMAHIRTNFADAAGTGFPEGLPLLLFVVANNSSNPGWLQLHEEQAAAVSDGTVVPIDGEHYLHHAHSAKIAEGFRAWSEGRAGSGVDGL
ncbi:alpha/beta fold hydrolase [Agreia sp. Leaf283]|uniref:alpha/beta hydrolase n=1 Tax=Agreia sp. Leaf283 TaxID=1736321 RepID=UPI0006F95B04|nr:alpha/beta hydrolase [Agreia sp. Leaf283]KQP55349.1 alpha/beta hydrolase [Agreia sp. Leaf283]